MTVKTWLRIGRWRIHRRRVRQLLAAAAAAVAVYAVLGVLAPTPPPTVPVVVAAHALAAGARPAAGDVRVAAYPRSLVPAGTWRAATAVPDRPLAVAVGVGEPLTGGRFVGPELLAAGTDGGDGSPEGALPLRFGDAGAVALLRPGDRIDVWAAATTGTIAAGTVAAGTASGTGSAPTSAQLVAAHVRVLAVPSGTDGSSTGVAGAVGSSGWGAAGGGLVVLGCSRDQAAALAQAAAERQLTPVIVRS